MSQDKKQRQFNPELDLGDVGRLVCHCTPQTGRCPYFGEKCPNYLPPMTREQFLAHFYGIHIQLIPGHIYEQQTRQGQ